MSKFFIPTKIIGFYRIKEILNNNQFIETIRHTEITFQGSGNSFIKYTKNSIIFCGLQKTQVCLLSTLTEEILENLISSLYNQKITFLTNRK